MSIKHFYQIVSYKDFSNVIKKQELSGTISATTNTYKTILVYDRVNGELIASTVKKNGETFKFYLPLRNDEQLTAMCRDEGGDFNADIYDRLSLCTVTYEPTSEMASLVRYGNLWENKEFINFSSSFKSSYLYDLSETEDLKGTIKKASFNNSDNSSISYFDESNTEVTEHKLDEGIFINERIPLSDIDKKSIFTSFDKQGHSLDLTHDILGDNSAVLTFPFSGETVDLSGNYELGGVNRFSGTKEYIGIHNSNIFRNNNQIPFGFLSGRDYSISFWLNFITYSGNSSLNILTNPGGFKFDLYYNGSTAYLYTASGSTSWNSYKSYGFTSVLYNMSHFTVTISSTGAISLYVNGIFDQTQTHVPISASSHNSGITSFFNTTDTYFMYANMRLFRIFNKVVSQEEVTTIHNELPNVISTNNISVPIKKASPLLVTDKSIIQSKSVKPYMDFNFTNGVYDTSGLSSTMIDSVILLKDKGVFFDEEGHLQKAQLDTDTSGNFTHGNEANVHIFAEFFPYNFNTSQIIWKSGDGVNGIAVGLKNGEIGVYGANTSVLSSVVLDTSNLIKEIKYKLFYDGTTLKLFDDQNLLIDSKPGLIDVGTCTTQESVGLGVQGSPQVQDSVTNEGQFHGIVSLIETYNDAVLKSNGQYKIAAEIAGTGQQCFVDVQKWEPENNECILWITIPTLSPTEDNTIRLYFDSSHENNISYVDNSGIVPDVPVNQDEIDLRNVAEADTVCSYSTDNVNKKLLRCKIPSRLINEYLYNFPVIIDLNSKTGINYFNTNKIAEQPSWENLIIKDEEGNQLYTEVEKWEVTEGGGSELWTPADINTELWLDATDSNTITIDTGVSLWADKSGKERHAVQNTTSYQPTYNESTYIQVEDDDDYLTIQNHYTASTHSIYVVLENYKPDTSYVVFSVGDVNKWLFCASETLHFSTPLDLGCGTVTYRINAQDVTPANIGEFYPLVGTSKVLVELKGVDLSGVTSFSLSGYGQSYGFEGRIYEILSTTNDDDREEIEGYLAWKWGLEGNLPEVHSYKLAAPIQGGNDSYPTEFTPIPILWDENKAGTNISISLDGKIAWGSGHHTVLTNIGVDSGEKIYLEMQLPNPQDVNAIWGICHDDITLTSYLGSTGNSFSTHSTATVDRATGSIIIEQNITQWVNGGIVNIAIDGTNGLVWLGHDGVWEGGGNPTTGYNPTLSGFDTTNNGLIYVGISPYTLGSETSYQFTLLSESDEILYSIPDGFTLSGIETVKESEDSIDARLHIKIPKIYKNKDTVFYIDYTNDTAQSSYIGQIGSTPAQNVWSNGYAAVYHLGADEFKEAVDSTANGRDLTLGTAQNLTVINDVLYFNDGYLEDSDFNLTISDQAVFEWYGYKPNTASDTVLFNAGINSDVTQNTFWSNGNNCFYGDIGSGSYSTINNYWTTTEYTYTALIAKYDCPYNDSIYIDYFQNIRNTGTYAQVTNSSIDFLRIGKGQSSNNFSGALKEFRVSEVTRSDAWLKATNLSLSNNLIEYSFRDFCELSNPLTSWESSKGVNITIPSSSVNSELSNFKFPILMSNSSGTNSFDFADWFSMMLENMYIDGTLLNRYNFKKNGLSKFNTNNSVMDYPNSGLHQNTLINFNRNANRAYIVNDFNLDLINSGRSFSIYIEFMLDNTVANQYYELFGNYHINGLKCYIYNNNLYFSMGVSPATYTFTGYLMYYQWNRVCFSVDMENMIYYLFCDDRLVNTGVITQTPTWNSNYDFYIGRDNYSTAAPFATSINRLIFTEDCFKNETDYRGVFGKKVPARYLYIKEYSTAVLNSSENHYLPFKGTPITSFSTNIEGFVSVCFTFDKITYKYYNGTSWISIVTKDDSIHGDTGNTNWFYKDKFGNWNENSNLTNAITLAVKQGYSMTDTRSLTQTEFDLEYDLSTGIIEPAFTFKGEDETLYNYVDNITINNVHNYFTKEYNLEPFNEIITGSKIDWALDSTLSATANVYIMYSNGTEWLQCTRQQSIPGITVGMVTTGLKYKFKIEWDSSNNLDEKSVILDVVIY